METKVEKLPKSRVKLTITVGPIEMGDYFARALNSLATDYSAPGFRPGKAPMQLVEKQIGDDKVATEALEIAIPLSYFNAVKKENLTPIEQPKVDVKEFGKGKRMVFQAEVDVMPEIKVGDYRKIKIQNSQSKIKITDKDIEEVLKQLQRQISTPKPVNRAAKKEDLVEVDFESFIEGKPMANGKSQNHPLVIGQGQFVKEFEENLVGMKKDEKKEFSVKFPSDFQNKEIANKKIDFKVLMKDIKEIILPEIDEAFALKFGKKDLKSLKESIKESKIKEEEKKVHEKSEQELTEKIAQISEVEIPESLVNAEVVRIFQGLVYQIESKGLKFEDYLKNLKKTQEDLVKDLRKPAEQNVKISLVLGEIKKKEGIKATEAEVENDIKKLEEQKVQITDEVKQRIRNALEIRKTVDYLMKITNP
ncbi:MAG: trigger factor [Candidatus Berkelbacteria bacterium]|nr:trigger factor [Candidatus Berkelbacteria bacterium]